MSGAPWWLFAVVTLSAVVLGWALKTVSDSRAEAARHQRDVSVRLAAEKRIALAEYLAVLSDVQDVPKLTEKEARQRSREINVRLRTSSAMVELLCSYDVIDAANRLSDVSLLPHDHPRRLAAELVFIRAARVEVGANPLDERGMPQGAGPLEVVVAPDAQELDR